VIDLKTKLRIIDCHRSGMSIRGIHRETIRKHDKAYEEARRELETSDSQDEQRVSQSCI